MTKYHGLIAYRRDVLPQGKMIFRHGSLSTQQTAPDTLDIELRGEHVKAETLRQMADALLELASTLSEEIYRSVDNGE